MGRPGKWTAYEYGVYDQADGGLLVYMGTAQECAKWLGIRYDSLTRSLRRGGIIEKRYKVEIIKEV